MMVYRLSTASAVEAASIAMEPLVSVSSNPHTLLHPTLTPVQLLASYAGPMYFSNVFPVALL